jgi:hypothetical protein
MDMLLMAGNAEYSDRLEDLELFLVSGSNPTGLKGGQREMDSTSIN